MNLLLIEWDAMAWTWTRPCADTQQLFKCVADRLAIERAMWRQDGIRMMQSLTVGLQTDA